VFLLTQVEITATSNPALISKDPRCGNVAMLNLPENQEDIDDTYQTFLHELAKAEVQGGSSNISKDDYFKDFRTRVVLAWIFSNVFLILSFTIPEFAALLRIENNLDFNLFMSFFLWSVAILAAFRFCGSVAFKVGF
jgi:chitin synthase